MTEKPKRIRQTFFAFQNFIIHQDKCGMKVCTDSVLFGAFINSHLKNKSHILDIGAGTGLLSIMMQQHGLDHSIEAVECDENAFLQCQQNIEVNKVDTINVRFCRIQDFEPKQRFNAIVSNPPFFTGGLIEEPPEVTQKLKAMHTLTLSHTDLIKSIDRMIIKDGGVVFILLPEFEMTKFELEISLFGFYPFSRLIMKNKDRDPILRIATAFSASSIEKPEIRELIIREENGAYTNEYVKFTEFYYKESNFKK
jgi:tRNA1Val (adenine37-N6)-methyltransferase